MPLKRSLTLILSLAFIAPFSFAVEPLQKWEVDGVERQALVFAPVAAKTEAVPLIFAFHGHGGNMRNSSTKFKYQELWPQAIVIYPQGLPTPGRLTDPEGKKNGWQGRIGDQADRDLKFFDAMLTWARATYKVDDKRIYCTGHSNGGGFTYTLWESRGDVFAAVAPACALSITARNLKPKPALHIAGTKDPLVKYEWQQATIDVIRKINGCEPQGKTEGAGITIYASPTGNPVETFTYDGGHAPPAQAWGHVVKFFKENARK